MKSYNESKVVKIGTGDEECFEERAANTALRVTISTEPVEIELTGAAPANSGGEEKEAEEQMPSVISDDSDGAGTAGSRSGNGAPCRDAFPRLQYRPELDGLRMVAIVPVVAYHYDLSFPSGFAGVDVFFVISGYLITCIVLADVSRGRFSFSRFWNRRIRRLFPALVVLLTVTLAAGWYMLWGGNNGMLPSSYSALLSSTWATLVMGANIHFFNTMDYFSDPLSTPLLHTWSLAVEEQFYLLHPLLLWALWRMTRSPRRIGTVLTVIGVASFTTSVVVGSSTKEAANFNYYLLPSRAWEMVLGSLLAFDRGASSPFAGRRVCAEVASWLSVAMILAACFVFGKPSPSEDASWWAWPSFPALMPCLGTALFIASERPRRTSIGRVLSTRPAVFVGQMSYSWYLWHWPTLVFMVQMYGWESAEIEAPITKLSGGILVLTLLMSVAAGVVSFVAIEPIWRRRTRTKALAHENEKRGGTVRALQSTAHVVPDAPFMGLMTVAWTSLMVFSIAGCVVGIGGIWVPNMDDCLGVVTSPDKTYSPPNCPPPPLCTNNASKSSRINLGHLLAARDSVYCAGRGGSSSYCWDSNDVDPPIFGHPNPDEGVQRPDGTRYPTVAFVGSSFCGVMLPTVNRLAHLSHKRVGSLCRTSTTAHLGQPGMDDAKRFGYLKVWKPSLIVWIDSHHRSYDYSTTLRAFMEVAPRVLILGEPAFLPLREGTSPGNYLYHRAQQEMGNLSFVRNIREMASTRQIRHEAEEEIRQTLRDDPALASAARFVEMASHFVGNDSGVLRPINPDTGRLVYRDPVHISDDGAVRYADVIAREAFQMSLCGGVE